MFKHTTKMFAILFVFASIIMFISCQDQPSIVTPDSNQISLPKYSLPAGETLVSAKLYMWGYTYATSVPQVINIHKVTSDWQENNVTWNSFGGAYNSVVSTAFTANTSNEWSSIDITSLVQDWLNGETNYGILLKNRDIITNDNYATWSSKDGYEYQPYLEIVTSAGSTQLNVLADAYLKELNPDNNYGLHVFNYSGFEGDPAKEKQTLMRFDIEPTTQDGGCTLTSGYWKTHSEFGPASYDDTWAQLTNGASTSFFLSGKSYHQVLWTSAFGGNAYYILAHAYIAAQLNFLNGADPTDAQTAFDNATTLFNTYTPLQISQLRGNNSIRNQFIALSIKLGKYNIGLIGPGHCHF